jgi:tetratricopeptide (TPR) repeat protein
MTVRVWRLLPWHRRPLLSALGVLALLGLGGWSARAVWRQTAAAWHWRQAEQAQARGDLASERAHLALCLEGWPDSGEVHFAAARAARRAGAYSEARDHLAHCQRLRWPTEALTLERELALAQRGELGEAEGRLLELAHSGHPDARWILEALALGCIATYRLPGALHCAEQLLRLQPDHPQALVCRGWALEQLQRFEEALNDYRRAVALAPANEWARLSLAEVLLHLGQPAEAAEQFECLLRRRPDNAAFRLGLARCRVRLGQVTEARRLLDGLLAEALDEPPVLSERGRLALQEGQKEEAERLLRQALERAPADRQAADALAQCLQATGRSAEAEEYRTRARRIEADQNRLTELAQRIVQAPRAPAERAEAGVLCLRLGREAQGLHWLRSALHEDPGQPVAHQTLAGYYEDRGQPERAARHRQLAAPQAPAEDTTHD